MLGIPGAIRESIRRRPTMRRILANTAWLSWDQAFRMGFSLVAGLWVARYLGVELWGVLTYSLALVGVFVPFITLGLDGIMVRDLVVGNEAAGRLLGTGFFIKSIGAIVAGISSLLLVIALRPGVPVLVVMVGVLSLGMIFTTFDVIEYWFRSRVESRYSVIARNIGVAAAGIAKVVLIVVGATVVAFAAAIALEYVIVALALLMVYRQRGGKIRDWSVSRGTTWAYLREGWPLGLTSMALAILLQANEVVLGQMVGAEQVGLYSASRRLAEIWFFVPLAVATSVGPSLVAFRSESPETYRARMVQVFSALAAFAIPICLLATVFAEPVVVLVFGNEYREAASSLRVYIWVLPFFSWLVAQSTWDINEGLGKERLVRMSLGVVTLLALDIGLVPPFGAIGASISAAAAFCVVGFLGNLAFRKTWDVLLLQVRSLSPKVLRDTLG